MGPSPGGPGTPTRAAGLGDLPACVDHAPACPGESGRPAWQPRQARRRWRRRRLSRWQPAARRRRGCPALEHRWHRTAARCPDSEPAHEPAYPPGRSLLARGAGTGRRAPGRHAWQFAAGPRPRAGDRQPACARGHLLDRLGRWRPVRLWRAEGTGRAQRRDQVDAHARGLPAPRCRPGAAGPDRGHGTRTRLRAPAAGDRHGPGLRSGACAVPAQRLRLVRCVRHYVATDFNVFMARDLD